MAFVLNGLVIDTSAAALRELEASLRPEFNFEYIHSVNTVHKAVQHHMDTNFQLCFIGDKFPAAEVHSFFNDYQKLQKTNTCIFVQFRDKLSDRFDRTSMADVGFHCVISKNASRADKHALHEAIKPLILQWEYEEARIALPEIVENLTKELDKIAFEKKRGRTKRLNTIYANHLKTAIKKFDKLLADYVQRLEEVVVTAEPFITPELNVPESITKKNLPHLTRTGYVGQSHRVFERLQKLHGEKKNPETESKKEPSSDTE